MNMQKVFEQFARGGAQKPGGDNPTNDTAETVHISSLALLKMLKHGMLFLILISSHMDDYLAVILILIWNI